MNYTWASEQLEIFIEFSRFRPSDEMHGQVLGAPIETIEGQVYVVEQILDIVMPHWRLLEVGPSDAWDTLEQWQIIRKAAMRAKEAMSRHQELRENIGENAPELSAARLHPWVWDGARSLWQSRHYRSAVEDALKKVNAEAQNKVDRRDVSETNLFREAFSENPPQAGKPRLRRMANDGSDTYKSLQRGAMALAEGIYAGIRNPLNHEAPSDLSDQVALEYLAALSVLARWVDEATVEKAV